MSGAEVAGLVLAVLPLCISALEHYKSGKSVASSFFKWGKHLDDLIFRLKTQRMVFYLNAMILLKAAGVDDVTGKEEATCVALLLDKETSIKIKNYLDFTYDVFDQIINRYEKCLKEIIASIQNIKRLPKASGDDLKAVLEANPSTNGKFAFKQRLDFTLERGRLKVLLDDLKEDNLTLETITKGMRTVYSSEPQPPSTDTLRLVESFQRVQRYAVCLYKAISSKWVPGCHDQHQTMMHLDARLASVQTKAFSKDPVCFEIFFCSQDDQSTQRSWHAATIDAMDDHSYATTSVTSQSNPVSSAAGRIPKVTIVAPSDEKAVERQPLKNICLAVKEARARKQKLALKLIVNALYQHKKDSAEPESLQVENYDMTISLESFLTNTRQNEELHLDFKQRTLVALCIASSVLQLNSTQWFNDPWTKRQITFFVKDMSIFDIDADRPVVIQTVGNPVSNTALGLKCIDVKEALLELAILLLEIWHHKTLEIWSNATKSTYSDTFDGRRSAAIRWLEMSEKKLPLNHASAIEACLQVCAGRLRQWDDKDFCKQMCEGIIKPLRENCKAW